MLKLYDYFRSSACFRVRITLNIKSLPYEVIPVHLINHGGEQHSTNYKHINPQGLVPALQDGNHIITQSLSIIGYLDDLHPLPPICPSDPYQKALVKAFALTICSDIHPLNNLRVLKYLTSELQISEEKKNAWYQRWIAQGLSALEKQLITYGLAGDFCFGNTPTLADICLVPQLYNARRFACDLSPYPTLVRADANCQQLSAFTNAWPVDPALEVKERT